MGVQIHHLQGPAYLNAARGLVGPGDLDMLCGHEYDDSADFWSRWKNLQPDHPVYERHKSGI